MLTVAVAIALASVGVVLCIGGQRKSMPVSASMLRWGYVLIGFAGWQGCGASISAASSGATSGFISGVLASVVAVSWGIAVVLHIGARRLRAEMSDQQPTGREEVGAHGQLFGAFARAAAAWPRRCGMALVRAVVATVSRVGSWWRGLFDPHDASLIRAGEDLLPVRGEGRWALAGCGVLCLFAFVLMASAFGATDPSMRLVIGQYFSLVGLSVLLAVTPVVIAVWVILVLLSRRPMIAVSLQKTGDLAGRGLVGGLIVGVGFYAFNKLLPYTPIYLPEFESGAVEWLSVIVGLSLIGTFLGFAAAQLQLLDLACTGQRRPRLAWLAVPFATGITTWAVGSAGIGLDAKSVYSDLVAGVVADLPHVPEASISMADVSTDWRYAFLVDQGSNLDLVPDVSWLAAIVGTTFAVTLWRRWHRSSARILESAGSDRIEAAGESLARAAQSTARADVARPLSVGG